MSAIPADDRGLLLGDGLFETVLFKAGEAVLWDAHTARLTRGCIALGLPHPDVDDLAAAAAGAIEAAGLGEVRAAARLTWTAGFGGRGLDRPAFPEPRLIATAAPSARPDGPATVITSDVRRNAGSPASRLKTLSYLDNVLARRQARADGADEALMLDGEGRLACASAANLFWIKGDELFTPAPECGVLAGIIRAEVIAATGRLGVPVFEVRARPTALDDAEALFLTNSLIGIHRIARLDGRRYGGHGLIETLEADLAALL